MALGHAGKGVRAGCVWHPDALLVPTIPRFLIGAVWLPVFHLPPLQGLSSLLLAAGLAACPHQCSPGTTYCCCLCQLRGGSATGHHPVCAHTRSSAPGAGSIPEHLLLPREHSTCAGGLGATRDWAGKWLGTALPQLRLRSHQVDKKQWLYFRAIPSCHPASGDKSQRDISGRGRRDLGCFSKKSLKPSTEPSQILQCFQRCASSSCVPCSGARAFNFTRLHAGAGDTLLGEKARFGQNAHPWGPLRWWHGLAASPSPPAHP